MADFTTTAYCACGSCLSNQKSTNQRRLESQRELCCSISTTSCPLLHTLSQNQQHVSLEQPRPLPPGSSLASPYLNEHPQHGNGITHFWHFSAKSSMGAKIKLSERTELSGRPPPLPVRQRNRQQGHFVLLYCLPEQNPLRADSPLVSAVGALISTS